VFPHLQSAIFQLFHMLYGHLMFFIIISAFVNKNSVNQMQQTPRNIKKIRRSKVAQLTKLLTKKDVIKEEMEIAQVRIFFLICCFYGCALNLSLENSRICSSWRQCCHGT